MLINFTLFPIEEIEPWITNDELSLSWFGLTDGQYWIQVGQNSLFEYSDYACSNGAPRYCNYHVVRLHEDLLEMLPHILEPVPPAFLQHISGSASAEWSSVIDFWRQQNEDMIDFDRFFNIMSGATEWRSKRHLDSGYLSPSVNVFIWSDEESVFLEWDNRERLFNDHPAWKALHGQYKLSRLEFIEEIRLFHGLFVAQMAQRVEKVIAGALSPNIRIHLEELKREQERKSQSLETALKIHSKTDWQEAEQAISAILIQRKNS